MYLYAQRRANLGEGGDASQPDQPYAVLNKFAFGSSKLTNKHYQQIGKIANYVLAQQKASTPIRWIYAVGHTDATGKPDINCRLGMYRARAVIQQLMLNIFLKNGGRVLDKLGVIRETLGGTVPVEGDRALSRRVEVYLLRSDTPPKFQSKCPQPAWCLCDR
jgi:OmpA family